MRAASRPAALPRRGWMLAIRQPALESGQPVRLPLDPASQTV